MNLFSLYLSVCCDAEPTEESVDQIDGEIVGICSCCKEWATFYDDEEVGEDWLDEIEYMVEHRDEL